MNRFFLIDCNNFFVSCERVFNPKLIGKPVVVLSNNDGCIISRSNEAKALGIRMGEPLFECEALIKKHNVHVFSSNFSLYADMSARIMETLARESADIEVYSIDEAFLFAPTKVDPVVFGNHLRQTVKKHTGIPISIGIGPTKTLSKVANKFAKKNPNYNGVFDITDHPQLDALLGSFDVGDIWGVGRQYAKMLRSAGITNAKALKYAPDAWVRKKMTIVGLKMVLELRGIPCLGLVDEVPKKSITVSRTFGRTVSDKHEVKEAVASYIIRAAEKLRYDHLRAHIITVFVATSRYHESDRYFNAVSCTLPRASDYTPELLDAATECLEDIFRPGLLYKKAGVLLDGLVAADEMQLDLLQPLPDISKQQAIMKACDKINSRFGRIVTYVSAGKDCTWRAKRQLKSPHYTTNWHELLTVT